MKNNLKYSLLSILVIFIASVSSGNSQYLSTTIVGDGYIGIVKDQIQDSLNVSQTDTEKTIPIDSITTLAALDNTTDNSADNTAVSNKRRYPITTGDIWPSRNRGRAGKRTLRQRSNTQITTEAENIEILLGATILSPGGINVSLGFQGNDYGIRASVGKKDDLKGIQLNFCRNLIKQKYFESNFSIGMGYTTESVDRKSYFYWDNEQKYQQSILYLGMFLNIHVSVLFAEIGWTTNVVGVDPAPHFRYQLGCIYIFK